MPDLKKTAAWKFFEESSLSLKKIYQGKEYQIDSAPLYKVYKTDYKIPLSNPIEKGVSLIELLKKRRSIRNYSQEPISLEELSTLLWASYGINQEISGYKLRTAPSAGALYPIETYLSVRAVKDVPSGLYHFNIKDFELELLQKGDFSYYLTRASLNQFFVAEASVVVCWSCIFRRTMSKYGERGMRYIFMDVGHVCQNLLLAAESLGLGACPIGAFLDDEMNKIFGLDKETESIIYCATIGKKA